MTKVKDKVVIVSKEKAYWLRVQENVTDEVTRLKDALKFQEAVANMILLRLKTCK